MRKSLEQVGLKLAEADLQACDAFQLLVCGNLAWALSLFAGHQHTSSCH